MKILVTRPEPDAERTAAALRARGHEAVLAPLLRIIADADVDLGPPPFGGVAITSANALQALASHPRHAELTRLPLYAVGRRSAEAARAAGFQTVVSADKDVSALIAMIRARQEGCAPILYLAAEDRAGDLGRALADAGIAVRTVVVYRAVAVTALPEEALFALRAGALAGVLHFSRRSAETYVACARAAGLLPQALRPVQYCISEQAAAPLAAAGAADMRVAAHPDEAALIALIPAAEAS